MVLVFGWRRFALAMSWPPWRSLDRFCANLRDSLAGQLGAVANRRLAARMRL